MNVKTNQTQSTVKIKGLTTVNWQIEKKGFSFVKKWKKIRHNVIDLDDGQTASHVFYSFLRFRFAQNSFQWYSKYFSICISFLSFFFKNNDNKCIHSFVHRWYLSFGSCHSVSIQIFFQKILSFFSWIKFQCFKINFSTKSPFEMKTNDWFIITFLKISCNTQRFGPHYRVMCCSALKKIQAFFLWKRKRIMKFIIRISDETNSEKKTLSD